MIMDETIKLQITAHEKKLQQAMLDSDIATLEQLFSDDLIFTNHLGHLMSKQDDLNLHRSPTTHINDISLSDLTIRVYDSVAIVTAQAHIDGSFNGLDLAADFRFTRIWNNTSHNAWRLVAAHSTLVPDL